VWGIETLGLAILFAAQVNERLCERIKLWCNGKHAKWACALIGKTIVGEDGKVLLVIEDFIDLIAYNVHSENGVAVCLEDLARIAEKYSVVGLLHTDHGSLEPSANDIAIALYAEIMSSNPLIHVIASPKQWLVFSFENCWKCTNSFFSLLKSRKNSGEVIKDE
jgi:hypothetical protein